MIVGSPTEQDDARAVVLIRAMINAAKADGQLDQEEQDQILGQLGDVTEAEIQWVRDELGATLGVRDFVDTIPIGMEEQAYSVSLMAIDLDTNPEANYLRELAHGFRMDPETCNQIHVRFEATPEITTRGIDLNLGL